ncbi:MAG: ribonuclease E inhibitor RraB [Pyrinomonadaceae bacterium MAG19_C2-C3]|nr:ribonuclease E inhibitor RraB [Pyrinomonadaceae bacterium MAG19_C2-C3]
MNEPKDKTVSLEQLLSDLKSGDFNKSHDAVHDLLRLSSIPTKKVVAILHEAEDAFSREQATYVLSWTHGTRGCNQRLQALLDAFNREGESVKVRAQALEGFANQHPSKKHKLRNEVEAAIFAGLSDESVEIRFWACFAAGSLEMKAALPRLQELVGQDTKDWGAWWTVSEEAEDAIDGIHGRITEGRIPIANRSKPHDIQFSMDFPNLELANKVAKEIRQQGYDTKNIEVESDRESVDLKFVKKQMIVVNSEMIALRKHFDALAAKYKGIYWGWGMNS